MRRMAVGALAALVLGVAGCELVTGLDGGPRLAYITGYDDDDPHVTVPATAQAGLAFTVRVRTYGGGCVSQGNTHVFLESATATIMPYDRHSGAEACTQELELFEHAVDLTFDEPGIAHVTVRGREGGSDDTVTFTYEVEVQP